MTEAIRLCEAGHDIPKAMPLSARASAATGRVVGEREHGVADDQQRQHAELDPPRADRSIAEPPGPTTSSPIRGGTPSSSPTSLRGKSRTSWR